MPVINPTDADFLPMGANMVEDGSGATFRVRAPRARNVWVRGDFNDWLQDEKACSIVTAVSGRASSEARELVKNINTSSRATCLAHRGSVILMRAS